MGEIFNLKQQPILIKIELMLHYPYKEFQSNNESLTPR